MFEKSEGSAGVSRVNDVLKEGDAWTVCVYKHACTSKKIGIRDASKTWSPKYIDQVLNDVKKIFAVILEQQVKHRRAVEGISELFGGMNQYSGFLAGLGHIGGMRVELGSMNQRF